MGFQILPFEVQSIAARQAGGSCCLSSHPLHAMPPLSARCSCSCSRADARLFFSLPFPSLHHTSSRRILLLYDTRHGNNTRGVIHEMWIVDKSEHPQIKDLKIVGGDGLQVRREGKGRERNGIEGAFVRSIEYSIQLVAGLEAVAYHHHHQLFFRSLCF